MDTVGRRDAGKKLKDLNLSWMRHAPQNLRFIIDPQLRRPLQESGLADMKRFQGCK